MDYLHKKKYAMISTKKLFIKFLKDNNVYEQYMFNFNNRTKISKYYPKKTFTSYFETTDLYLAINNAFNWSDSPEHFRFWENLNTKWIFHTKWNFYSRNNISGCSVPSIHII